MVVIHISEIKNLLFLLINKHEQNHSSSTDFFNTDVCYHPMAEGKFLSSLALLYRAGVLSQASFEKKLVPACTRLAEAALEVFHGGAAWGLNFTHGGRAANEPYLITTSIILHGLNDCSICFDNPPRVLLDLQNAALNAVKKWIHEYIIPEEKFPRYSPNMDDCIYNAPAVAAAALRNVISDYAVNDILDKIKRVRVPDVGWTYGSQSNIVDLLHNAYILNAMPIEDLPINWIDDFLGIFWCGDDFCDTLRFYPDNENVKYRKNFFYRHVRYGILELHYSPARLWSLGELLVHLCKAARLDTRFLSVATSIASLIHKRFEAGCEEFSWSRYATHAMHGLAAYLNLKRTLAKEISSSAMPTQTVEESSQKC